MTDDPPRTRRRLTLGGVIVGVAAVLGIGAAISGLSDDPERAGEARPDTSAVTPDAGEPPLVGCSSSAWPPEVMPAGLPGVLTDGEARALFWRTLDDPRTAPEAELSLFPDGVDVPWRVLVDDGDELTIGLYSWTADGPGRDAQVLWAERDDRDVWEATGWATCTRLHAIPPPGDSWMEIWGYAADGAGLMLRGTETACASGRDPEPFMRVPVVHETSDQVIVSWSIETLSGNATCPGNPVVETSVPLSRPVGDREVMDGSVFPRSPVPRLVALRGRISDDDETTTTLAGRVWAQGAVWDNGDSGDVGTDGSFTLWVPTGEYMVYAQIPENPDGRHNCQTPRPFVVGSGGAEIELTCPVP